MSSNFWNLQRPSSAPADINVPKTIAESETVTSRLMEVLDSNAHGNVHGGVIMRMIDESAAIVAIKHSRRPVVTARVDQLNFLEPAYIGEVVTLHCALTFVGRTSMEVAVEVTAESLRTAETRRVCSCNIIYVALDENRKPVQVPPLKATNEEERQRIERAKARRERMRQMDEELKNTGLSNL
ncbi:MAG TPA: acyl-CoA thioesterase [Chloroflexia bacterium]|nr:acyl-CoA thioesterase [Chloroflexia bacterium]